MNPKVGDKVKVTAPQLDLDDIGFVTNLTNKIVTISQIMDGDKFYIEEDGSSYLFRKEFTMASWRKRYENTKMD